MGRLPDLDQPRTFTEWVQWRKLAERDSCHPALMDKIAAKGMAEDRLGRDWIIPTLWSGDALPDQSPVSGRAMLKARHGCNQNAVVEPHMPRAGWRRLQRRSTRWCERPYGLWLDEWAYSPVERGLLLEPFVSDTDALPVDYKIYVFGGQATHVQVHLDRGTKHRWVLHDRTVRPLVAGTDCARRPNTLTAMLDAAEALAKGEDFLRVDFYEVAGRPLFGEFCLYPGSGLDKFAAPWIDTELGSLWRHARCQREKRVTAERAEPIAAIL